jgi:hypothetical protein
MYELGQGLILSTCIQIPGLILVQDTWLYRKGFDGFLLSLQEPQIGLWLFTPFSLILEFNII